MNPVVNVSKLPVPGPWQDAVLRAMADLSARMGLPSAAMAPTRVEEAAWTAAAGPARGLEIWLMAAGRPHRYRVDLGSGAVEALGGQG